MIRNFRHRGLRLLYEEDDKRGVNAQHAAKLQRLLTLLNVASRPEEMNLPGIRLHPLKGDLAGYWSVTVQANWRIIFRFDAHDATDVDYLDYH